MYTYFAGADFKLGYLIGNRTNGVLIILAGLLLGGIGFLYLYFKEKSKSRTYLLAGFFIFIVLIVIVAVQFFMNSDASKAGTLFGFDSYKIKQTYGFFVGAIFFWNYWCWFLPFIRQ
jgi:hypothetical protein